MRSEAVKLFRQRQDEITQALEALDGKASFRIDNWQREGDGGGGRTMVLTDGKVFEQGGVNFSEVHGTLPAEMVRKLELPEQDCSFYATGISLVIHPRSPMVPTTHANFRYLEVGNKSWFGGGADLTPYYLFAEDAEHFHKVLKAPCDKHDPEYYPKFKKWCDEYFYLPHRGEARGIGGLFFDYLGKVEGSSAEDYYSFVEDISDVFLDTYVPIVSRRLEISYTEEQRQFQLLRRGRYVEFNLIYDRGTLFGLKTKGRTESILMSLPPSVSWTYDEAPLYPEGSEERKLLEVLQNPKDWA